MSFFDFLSQSMGIDLGTSNTLVYVNGKGITVNEPSVVAIKRSNNTVCAVGTKAKEMLERTPQSINAIRPLQSGVIADFEVTKVMIKYFIEKAMNHNKLTRARVVICVPVGVTSIEKRAVEEVAYDAGAKKVKLVEEPMAAAIGAGLPVSEAIGNMIVDIGGGTTEIAIISLGGIVVSDSVRIAGDDMDVDIKDYVKWKYKLEVGLISSEKIKKILGNTCKEYYDLENQEHKSDKENKENKENKDKKDKENKEDTDTTDTKEDSYTDIPKHNNEYEEDKYTKVKLIRGRDIVTGLPRSVELSCEEIREAIVEPVNNIVSAIKRVLERTPPELASDLYTNGIYLTGGGALLKGLDIYIEKETGLKVYVAKDPLNCVAIGAGKICETL